MFNYSTPYFEGSNNVLILRTFKNWQGKFCQGDLSMNVFFNFFENSLSETNFGTITIHKSVYESRHETKLDPKIHCAQWDTFSFSVLHLQWSHLLSGNLLSKLRSKQNFASL